MRMFNKIASRTLFLCQQRTIGFKIPDTPHLDDSATEYFLDRLSRCSSYLEYGCGGSTIAAAQHAKPCVSVESDPFYMDSVKKKILSLGLQPGCMIHVDIGVTVEWGLPMFKTPTPRRQLRWKQYAERPWKQSIRPDLILIDGRFRVNCALFCIGQARDCEILFDDYQDRPFYHSVGEFAKLEKMCGRMAILRPKNDIDRPSLLAAVARTASDYR